LTTNVGLALAAAAVASPATTTSAIDAARRRALSPTGQEGAATRVALGMAGSPDLGDFTRANLLNAGDL
jgi:hypothetical protein